jgi:hypothetical protein
VIHTRGVLTNEKESNSHLGFELAKDWVIHHLSIIKLKVAKITQANPCHFKMVDQEVTR